MTGSGNAVVPFSVCFSFRFTGETIIGASCYCGTPSLWKTYVAEAKMQQTEELSAGYPQEHPSSSRWLQNTDESM